MERGILIMAIGDPLYVEYAVNLAASIRATSEEPITLVHSNNLTEINAGQKFAFHKRIECPKDYYQRSKIEAKMWLDKLTPYDKTLFIDADTICTPYRNISDLFEELKGTEFKMICRGISDKSDFVEIPDMQRMFDIDQWNDLSSELIYFEKGTDIFEKGRYYYDQIEQGCWNRRFAGGVADEPALTVAVIKKFGIQSQWMPSYWEYVSGVNIKNTDIYSKFYIISVGGRSIPRKTTLMYNEMVKYYRQKTGIDTFTLREKSRVLKERKFI